MGKRILKALGALASIAAILGFGWKVYVYYRPHDEPTKATPHPAGVRIEESEKIEYDPGYERHGTKVKSWSIGGGSTTRGSK